MSLQLEPEMMLLAGLPLAAVLAMVAPLRAPSVPPPFTTDWSTKDEARS